MLYNFQIYKILLLAFVRFACFDISVFAKGQKLKDSVPEKKQFHWIITHIKIPTGNSKKPFVLFIYIPHCPISKGSLVNFHGTTATDHCTDRVVIMIQIIITMINILNITILISLSKEWYYSK